MGEEFDLNDENLRKIFVGGLNRSTTDDELRQYFQQFGDIQDHVVIKDGQSGTSRGFGFVTFNDVDSVENVLDENNQKQHEISGKSLDVKRAMPRDFEPSAHSKVKKLFAGGLSKDVDEPTLRDYLDGRHTHVAKCGHISNIEIKRDKETNSSKGFGFIEVSTTHLADRIAISERQFTLCDKKSTIKKAEPKGESGGDGGGRGGGGRGRGRGGPGASRGGGGGYQSNGYGGGYGGQQQGGYGGGQGGYGGGQQGGYGGQQGGYGGQQGGGYGMTSYPNQSQYGGYGGGY